MRWGHRLRPACPPSQARAERRRCRCRISSDTLALAINYATSAGTYTHPTPDIRDLAEWRTCAVVGSSHDLLGGGWGEEIDSHTAVIRFNDAPTRCPWTPLTLQASQGANALQVLTRCC